MSPILTVQSLLDHPSSSGRVRVCSRKHGQPCLTKAAAFDYAADGIRINAIAADQIDTPLIANGAVHPRRWRRESRNTRSDGSRNQARSPTPWSGSALKGRASSLERRSQ